MNALHKILKLLSTVKDLSRIIAQGSDSSKVIASHILWKIFYHSLTSILSNIRQSCQIEIHPVSQIVNIKSSQNCWTLKAKNGGKKEFFQYFDQICCANATSYSERRNISLLYDDGLQKKKKIDSENWAFDHLKPQVMQWQMKSISLDIDPHFLNHYSFENSWSDWQTSRRRKAWWPVCPVWSIFGWEAVRWRGSGRE